MADPDICTLNEAIMVVQGVAGWLQKAGPGVVLSFSPPPGSEEKPIVFVEDAQRAGRILSALMQTSGMA